jgi:hypothetical protein
MVVQGRVGEGVDGIGDVLARGFDGDVIVVGKVDSSLLLGGVVGDTEELTLDTGVDRAGDVLAVAPLSVARASCRAAAAAAATTAVASRGSLSI